MRKKKSAMPGHTLQEAIKLFVSQYRATSAKFYGGNLRMIANLIGPGRTVDTITPMHILDIQTYINAPEKNYSVATRMNYIRSVRVFFNWLVKNGFLEESPAKFLKLPRINHYIDPDKAMTDDELAKLLDFVKWKPRDLALVLFLADTGARAGGAARLKWSDIKFDEMIAMVTEKGDKTRPVAFGQVCADALKGWHRRRPASAGEYVFSPSATPMSGATISQAVTRNCIKVGIRPLGSHSLRHRKGHQFAEQRIAPTTAALAMGHSDVNVTLASYYPQGWARTEAALRGLVVTSLSMPGVSSQADISPSEPPATKTDEPRDSKIIVFKRPS